MARKRAYAPLNIFLNDRHLGMLSKKASGAIAFVYDRDYLAWDNAIPVSLSLPLRERHYTGAPVAAVFENLLPDSDVIRRRIAEHVGAAGTDAYSLLSEIGHDCVGALQFLSEDQTPTPTTEIEGTAVGEDDIAAMVANLTRVPLGLDREIDEDFRISVAGAQEKTALLRHDGKWMRPHGTTPTTHIFKPQIGQLPNGIDLSDSVENEFYCLKLLEAFGLPVNQAEIASFGDTQVLVVERFDRRWTQDGRLIRLPQEDCCQALSVPPTRKYQNEGGPGIVEVMALLQGSDDPIGDRRVFFMSQILFWIIGATDGHAKNFSLFLRPHGSFSLTPFYDVISAQLSLDRHHIRRNAFKLAMSVGNRTHYRIDSIQGRHFMETARRAGLSNEQARQVIAEVSERLPAAVTAVVATLPTNFPVTVHESVRDAVAERIRQLETTEDIG